MHFSLGIKTLQIDVTKKKIVPEFAEKIIMGFCLIKNRL